MSNNSADVQLMKVRARVGDFALSMASVMLLLGLLRIEVSTIELLVLALVLDVAVAATALRSPAECMMGIRTTYSTRSGRILGPLIFDLLVVFTLGVNVLFFGDLPLSGVVFAIVVFGGVVLWARRTGRIPWEHLARVRTEVEYEPKRTGWYFLGTILYVAVAFFVFMFS